MKKSVYLMFIILVLFIAAPFAGCGGGGGGDSETVTAGSDTPEVAKAAVVEALSAGDADTAILQFNEQDQKRAKESFEALGSYGMEELSEAIARGVIVEQTEEKIIYKTTVIDESGNTVEVKFRMYNVNGKWVFRSL